MRCRITKFIICGLMFGGVFAFWDNEAGAQKEPLPYGERPALEKHLDQAEIESGRIAFDELLEMGERIFAARWNVLDGQGRPAATGSGVPTKRDPRDAQRLARVSGPDATSCADCHFQPTTGGAAGFAANVFVLAQTLDPPTDSTSAEFSNERNSLGMNGAGAIEMLAREMSVALQAIRATAVSEARSSGQAVTKQLVTKGVSFGQITALPNGTVDTSRVEGVDPDLVIKPFNQKGTVVSLRVFSNNAMNHHHGMQAVERFGIGQKDNRGNLITTPDFDQDGVPDELTVGDITALTLFQAAMNIPGRVLPDDPVRRAAAERGERLFAQIGCTDCHRPALVLDNPIYSEPSRFNPPGNLRPEDVTRPVTFDLTREGPTPRLERTSDGSAIVRAFTDLKRHVICDDQDPYFCNERKVQDGVPTNQFLTRKLWDVGSTAPYGHRGDLTTITEAILHHAGAARPHRARFAALGQEEQAAIVEFLKTLQVLPPGAPPVVTESELQQLVRQRRAAGREWNP
ncbi:MAG: di-heme oxidoredictase family protein [Acidobacteriota bacterium]|nr:hypothetical protein [Blastocatellia bacterium]MDW8241425.1 di-heme oxidoredictase family protein [Acidobacteriota bacterium]